MKRYLACSVLTVFLSSSALAAETTGVKGEFGGHCALALTGGKMVQTDCSVHWADPDTKKEYCFGTEKDKAEFAKDTKGNLTKAAENYAKESAAASKPVEAPASATTVTQAK